MAEATEKNNTLPEPSFKVNYATVILLAVILITVIYTIVVNLQNPSLTPEVPAAQQAAPKQNLNATSVEAALKKVADKPDFDAYFNLGLAYYSATQYEDAIKAWNKAVELNPKSAVAYNDLAAAYGAVNKWDEEIEACGKALNLDPNMTLAKNNLSWAISQKHKK